MQATRFHIGQRSGDFSNHVKIYLLRDICSDGGNAPS